MTDDIARGLKSGATVPVVIDVCRPTFERSHMQEAGRRLDRSVGSVGSVGEKRKELALS